MDLRAVVIVALCISCASASKHERQKWMKWKEQESGDDCDTPEQTSEEPEYPAPMRIGSIPGTPGVDFPYFLEIPNTKFSCADVDYVHGFYADLETHCQVFHVCYEHRRETFLCPVGTIFSQPIKACDYWYSANCSASPKYYKEAAQVEELESIDPAIDKIIGLMTEKEITERFEGDHKALKPPKMESVKQKHGFFGPGKGLAGDEMLGYITKEMQQKVPLPKSLERPSKKSDLKGKHSGELTAALKEDAELAASLILKSLLPIKSKVISLIADEARKPKSAEAVSKTVEAKVEPVLVKAEPAPVTAKLVVKEKFQKPLVKEVKPKVLMPAVLSVPMVKMVSKVKAKVAMKAPLLKPATLIKPALLKPKLVKAAIPVKPALLLKPKLVKAAVPVKPALLLKPKAVKQIFPFHAAKLPVKAASLPVSLLTKKHLALNYAKLLKLKKLKAPLLGLKGFL